MGMKGEVIVGTGIDANKADSNRGESESTPGFIATASIAALIEVLHVSSQKGINWQCNNILPLYKPI